MNHNFKDLSGQKFGKLTVVDCTFEKTNKGNYIWNCLCDCGEQKKVPGSYLTTGHCKSCGCFQVEMYDGFIRKFSGHNRKEYGMSSFLSMYSRYLRGAKDRNLLFSLSLEQFREITTKECYYCGKF